MIGQMIFFLGLQISHTRKGIFISQAKYVKELLKKFGLEDSKLVGTPMVTAIKRIFKYLKGSMDYGLWYLRNDDFMLFAYIDANWASNVDDQKSTSSGAFFLGKKLVTWASKKQDLVSLSNAEVEQIVAASNCTQVILMQQMLKDIRVIYDEPTFIYCNNSSVINMSKNPMQH